MENFSKEKIEGQAEVITKHNDTVEAVYEAVFRIIDDIGRRDAVELNKRGSIAKKGKAINLDTHRGSTIIATDGKKIVMFDSEVPPKEKNNSNNIRSLAIMINELGEITDFELTYENEINLAKCPPFDKVTDVASKKAKRVIEEEKANAIMRFIHGMRKPTTIIDEGEMTEYDIQCAFMKLKNEANKLKWKRKNASEQKKAEKLEEFKDGLRIRMGQEEKIKKEDDYTQ